MTSSICETCGSAFRTRGDTCPDCGARLPEQGEIRRLPHGVVHQFLDDAEGFLAADPLRQLALAFAAGSFITFGAIISVALTVDVDSVGFSRLLLGLSFSVGFILVILFGSALFAEINVRASRVRASWLGTGVAGKKLFKSKVDRVMLTSGLLIWRAALLTRDRGATSLLQCVGRSIPSRCTSP